MELDVAALDGAREAWRSGRHADLDRAAIDTVTLGACLEGACWAATAGAGVLQLLGRWSPVSVVLSQALMALTTTARLRRAGEHDAPGHELIRCASRAELVDPSVGVEWRYFRDRFRRSLVTRLRLSSGKARGIAAALHEMVDNVLEHAGLGDEPRGLVACAVTEADLCFAVADLGRGVIASLRENPANHGITTDADALSRPLTQSAVGAIVGDGGLPTAAIGSFDAQLQQAGGSSHHSLLLKAGRGRTMREP